MRVLAALDEVAAETGAALATVTLAWTMAQSAIAAPIASATSLAQPSPKSSRRFSFALERGADRAPRPGPAHNGGYAETPPPRGG